MPRPGIANAAWRPELLSEISLDLDANLVPGNDGDLISTFSNRSPIGTAGDYTASGSARPTLKRNIIGGQSVLRFDGTANVMASTYQTVVGAQTHFFVFKLPAGMSLGTYGAAYTVVDTSGNPAFFVPINIGGYDPYTIACKITAVQMSVGLSDATDGNPHILGWTYDGSAQNDIDNTAFYTISLDGTNKTVTNPGAGYIDPTGLGKASLGAYLTAGGSASNFIAIDIARLLVFNGVLSTQKYAAVARYLSARYGI